MPDRPPRRRAPSVPGALPTAPTAAATRPSAPTSAATAAGPVAGSIIGDSAAARGRMGRRPGGITLSALPTTLAGGETSSGGAGAHEGPGPQPSGAEPTARRSEGGATGSSSGGGSGSGEGAARGGGGAGTSGADAEALVVRQSWHRPDLGIVLVQPQIPQNAGNVARTCAATGVPLHLVAPLGFELDDRKLKRAGLDYWHSVAVSVHASWPAFMAFFARLPQPKRLVAFTVYGDSYYAGPEFAYRPGDWLVFGAETSGLPPEAHAGIAAAGGALVKIPIRDTHVRSINLAVAAGVGLFEALRQLDEASGSGHYVAPRLSPSLAEVAAAHRDGKPLAKQQGGAAQAS